MKKKEIQKLLREIVQKLTFKRITVQGRDFWFALRLSADKELLET